MKEPEEIIKKFDYIKYELSKEFGEKKHTFTVSQVIEIIKQTQLDAWNEAVKECAEACTEDLKRYRKYYDDLRYCTKKNQRPSAKTFNKKYILKLLKE